MLLVGSGRHGGKLILYFVNVLKGHPKIKLICILTA